MGIDDLFNIEPEVPFIMDKDEYLNKSKEVFDIFATLYASSWQRRSLRDDEYPDELVCEACTGCGIYQENIGECNQDSIEGGCYVQYQDVEQLGIDISNNIEDVYTLLSVNGLN